MKNNQTSVQDRPKGQLETRLGDFIDRWCKKDAARHDLEVLSEMAFVLNVTIDLNAVSVHSRIGAPRQYDAPSWPRRTSTTDVPRRTMRTPRKVSSISVCGWWSNTPSDG
jgi:hypothetical protein